MRKLAIPFVAIAAVAVTASFAAASGKPTRSITGNVPFTLPAGAGCAFPTGYEPIVNGEITTTFPADANGDVRLIITGKLISRLTNLDNGKSLIVNISGPATIIVHPDGSVHSLGGGISAFPFFPTDTPPGPHWWLFTGRLDLTQTAGGEFVLNGIRGTQVDLCPQLA